MKRIIGRRAKYKREEGSKQLSKRVNPRNI
ncbi:MAG: hypothetical protein BWY28_02188 [bacterium ADurb.Bin236]|mgnify:CR=1 FL=1|nr:MAG: hypothetical protein BWY28_02188 [bacterium ADurb.Bin236]